MKFCIRSQFHFTISWVCDYLYMVGLKLSPVSKWAPSVLFVNLAFNNCSSWLYLMIMYAILYNYLQGRLVLVKFILLCCVLSCAMICIFCVPWASYQIRKIAGCACAGNAGNVFPRRRFQRKPLVSVPGMHHGTCVTHIAYLRWRGKRSRHSRRMRTPNFAYLARGPCYISLE